MLKVTVLGTRGIPGVLGGVETHCQNLYPEIVRQSGSEVTVIARSPYVGYKTAEYQGVQLRTVTAPKKKSLEAIIHSVFAAMTTLTDGSDIVHVHAIGPGLVVPLLRLAGKKVVFTHHGPDYDRQKWGRMAKMVLKLGEKLAVKFASEVIVISEVINQLIKGKYGRENAHLIHNGVNLPKALDQATSDAVLAQYDLTPKGYLVAVGRFVEEKGFHDLIQAYQQSGISKPLVLVGDADHPTPYSESLKQKARETEGVILTGFLKGDALQAVFSQAGLYVMPSYHEGLPIALLEAMSFSLPAIVSDIPANLEVALEREVYFPVSDVAALTDKLILKQHETYCDYRSHLKKYDWAMIAGQTQAVYNKITGN
ncbi:Putative teichuronic acid biosynthesis glycosyltransferase TuaC [Vibrio aerogenes CECT 7868]|uniref:Putative teichuronic acid biosynthesis glycosyltransferase TuaC n=1 Tax=Vibrio aerogenes CECT 7868 TaxID=1216006 RepID=A0A1M5VSF6_9VIBR|nr:glycosyltransferase family 4 protein [Vibrio aerogenes]SHH78196.1 Putative teichuronic acid biosynthesis glycosyltransferase TuaC [Vibrio aerogenes CECT 7868]